MISKKTKYAVKALVFLAHNYGKGPILIDNLSKIEKIPKKFLQAILLDLKKHGILGSKMGLGGGYYLAIKPSEVLLSEILRLTGGPIALIPCVSLNFYERCDDCLDETTCGIRNIMIDVREATLKILSKTSLEDILISEAKLISLKKNMKLKQNKK